MPVDARGLSAHVLVDGRAVPELSDPDTTPRDWAFLRTAATNGQVSPEAAAACAQRKCLVATTAGTRFEVVVVNATRHHLCVDTFVDGRKIDSLSLFGEHAARDEQTGAYGPDERYMWTARIEGDYVGATTASIATNAVRPMRFAQLRQVEEGGPATRDFGAASQAGRIDVVARVIEDLGDKKLMAAAPGSARGEDAQATGATKKDIFGLGTSYGDAIATAANSSEYGAMRTPRVSRDCFATFSFRYAAIEALHIAKTTPKAWLDRETALIEAARQSSRDLRRHLRAGFAISEPPTYLFSSKLSPLAGPGAPKAVADRVKLDKALRGEGFKLVGEPRSLFDALSHQLCGTHQLSRYVEHDSVCSTFLSSTPSTRLRSAQARRGHGAKGGRRLLQRRPRRLRGAVRGPLPADGRAVALRGRVARPLRAVPQRERRPRGGRPALRRRRGRRGEAAAARSGRRRRRLQGGRLGRRRVLGPGRRRACRGREAAGRRAGGDSAVVVALRRRRPAVAARRARRRAADGAARPGVRDCVEIHQ